jgi:solute carrier family 13 (sodium-dependent dicarboxylate transporter), member 2/3/5
LCHEGIETIDEIAVTGGFVGPAVRLSVGGERCGVGALGVFLTQLTSNTATTAAFVPILAGIAPGLGVHPFQVIVPVVLAASAAFMMPVATPPNAIVFGSGHVSMPQMIRAGFWMNLISIVIVTATVVLLVPAVLGTG